MNRGLRLPNRAGAGLLGGGGTLDVQVGYGGQADTR